MPNAASIGSRQVRSKGLGLKINNDIYIPWVESANEKQSFIKNLLSKISGVCRGKDANQFGKK